MKKFFTLFVLLIFTLSVFAQNTRTRRSSQERKPRTSPYVKKKDYEPQMEELTSKIAYLQGSISELKEEKESSEEIIARQNRQIDSLMGILQSTHIEVQATSDSLGVTTFSLFAFQNDVNDRFTDLNDQVDNANLYGLIGGGGLLLFLIIGLIYANQRSNNNAKRMRKEIRALSGTLEKKISESGDDMKRKISSAESGFRVKLSDIENKLDKRITTTESTLDVKVAETGVELDKKILETQNSMESKLNTLDKELRKKLIELNGGSGHAAPGQS